VKRRKLSKGKERNIEAARLKEVYKRKPGRKRDKEKG